MQLCDYGCGQKAMHQFGNGKWCCNSDHRKCPSISKKKSQSLKNNWKNRSQENIKLFKQEQSIRTKQKWKENNNLGSSKHLKRMSISQKKRYESIEEHRKLSIAHKKRYESIEERKKTGLLTKKRFESKDERLKHSILMKDLHKNNIEFIKKFKIRSKNIKRTIVKLKKKYPTFIKIEEMRYNPDKPGDKEIQVHCKNHLCKNSKEKGGWFTPTGRQIELRITEIENGNGGGYFYCSEKCKQECPLYGKTASQLIKQDQIDVGHLEDPWYNSQEYQEWRQHIFELDNSLCVYCGKEATIAHHILPQKTHPESTLDPTNGLSVCKECHYKYGHRDPWCTTGKLSTLVCERIIRIKEIL